MSRNDAADFAQRMYARIPAQYRVYDATLGQPLFALLKVVGAQGANLRQDLDALWDNFFIETCDDWVVPYIGALVGANLLQQPIGQSNRLEVWNTVLWRRSKGTPQMLQSMSQAISQWPADIAEFFSSLGWSQNLNHIRLDRPLTPDLRNPSALALLGHAADPFAHAADFKPAQALDEARVRMNSLGVGVAGWGTPGRYQIKNLGAFVRRLQPFLVKGVNPASAPPGVAPSGTLFKFNPLFKDVPLFSHDTGAPITRAAFAANPWQFFGTESDIAVRQSGVLLATETAGVVPALVLSQTPFGFGDLLARRTALISQFNLSSSSPAFPVNVRLLQPRSFQLGTAHFLISAKWQPAGGGAPITLGILSTLLSVASGLSGLPSGPAFQAFGLVSSAGQLIVTVETGHSVPAASPSSGFNIPASAAARFPGAVVAIQAQPFLAGIPSPISSTDGLYVYLPPAFVSSGNVLSYYVANDGSTYTSSSMLSTSLARASEGQVYPPRSLSPSSLPAQAFTALNRSNAGMQLVDPLRLGSMLKGSVNLRINVVIEADILTAPATYQPLGSGSFSGSLPLSPFTYTPSTNAINGTVPTQGVLSLLLTATGSPSLIPPLEVVIVNQAGKSLLVYLPQIPAPTSTGTRVLIADDGSTYFAPLDTPTQTAVLQQNSLAGLTLARASQGQALPMPGVWPVRQRIPVSLNLCRSERSSLLNLGELGIDPELGHFALPAQDPALARGGFSVDFVEAFSEFVGAVNSNSRQPTTLATRLVSQTGDANSPLTQVLTGAPVHSSLAAAIAAAQNGDVIEIVDSGTYGSSAAITVPPTIQNLTIRAAAGQRPCLTFYQSTGQPANGSLIITQPMASLTLDGLLISGGPMLIQSTVNQLQLSACTLDPTSQTAASLICSDLNAANNAGYVFSRCITGGLLLGAGVAQLTIADSIVDQRGGTAIAGVPGSPPPSGQAVAGTVQLERTTVLGTIFSIVLNASESLLNDIATVLDQQSGCLRFTRFEAGSSLPRRYRCIPTNSQLATWSGKTRLLAPVFSSRLFGRPDYVQLGAAACPPVILSGSESGAEVGAFAGAQNSIRLSNLKLKLQEFMPVGLSALVLAES